MLMEIEIEIGEGEGERETETERQREKEREEWGSQRHCCRSLIFFDPISVFFSASHSCSITRPLTHSQQDTQAHQRLHFPVKNHHRTTTASPVHVSTIVERVPSAQSEWVEGSLQSDRGCSRLHTKASISPTLLISNMYQRPDMLTNPSVDPQGQALDPRKIQDNFEDFYEDLFEELSKYGLIESLNICDNLADHMMERDCLWLLRSWAHVIFTLRTEMLLMLLTKVQNHQEAFSDSFKAPLEYTEEESGEIPEEESGEIAEEEE